MKEHGIYYFTHIQHLIFLSILKFLFSCANVIFTWIISIAYFGCTLGLILYCSFYVMLYFDCASFYNKIQDSFSSKRAFLFILAAGLSILIKPIFSKVVLRFSLQGHQGRFKGLVVVVLIFGSIESLCRFLFDSNKNIKPEIIAELENFGYFSWTSYIAIIAFSSFFILFAVEIIHRVILDYKSRVIYKKIVRNVKTKYALFLRPFDIDDKMNFLNYGKSIDLNSPSEQLDSFKIDMLLSDYTYNVEVVISSALDKTTPLVGLGKFAFGGVGRIATRNDQWKEVFHRMARNAEILFSIPGVTKGMLYELKWIFENKASLSRTIFILPPQKISIYDQKRWAKIKEKCLCLGIILPVYKADGILFQINEFGQYFNLRLFSSSPQLLSFSIKTMLQQSNKQQ